MQIKSPQIICRFLICICGQYLRLCPKESGVSGIPWDYSIPRTQKCIQQKSRYPRGDTDFYPIMKTYYVIQISLTENSPESKNRIFPRDQVFLQPADGLPQLIPLHQCAHTGTVLAHGLPRLPAPHRFHTTPCDAR